MRVKGSPYKINGKEFAKRIKKLRLKHDLKQYEVAKAIQKTRAAYGGCENGSFLPGIEMIIGLREFYKRHGENLSLDYLFGYVDNPEGLITRIDQSSEIKTLEEAIKKNEDLIETQRDLIRMLKEKLKD